MNRIKGIILAVPLLRHLAYLLRRNILKSRGHIIGSRTKIGFSTQLEGKNSISDDSTIFSSQLGFGSYIGSDSHFSKTKIGKYCSIGQNVKCIFGKHPTKDFISTHPAFFSKNHSIGFSYVSETIFKEHAENRDEENKYSIVVGNDVWISDNVSIMEGVVIGDGAIIAANALVTKDVSPYTIIGGVPGKVIKTRFSNEEMDYLLALQWWNKPESWIKEHASYFNNFEKLQSKIKDGQ